MMDSIGGSGGGGGRSQGPKSIFCYICSRPFGSKSIKIHEPQCMKKWRAENEKLPKRQRRPEPHKPTLIETGQIIDYDAMNQMLWEASQKALMPCEYCHRTFANAERLEVHQRSCAEFKKFKDSPEWLANSAAHDSDDDGGNRRRPRPFNAGKKPPLSRETTGQSLDVQKRPQLPRRSISERHKREHPKNTSPPPSPQTSPSRGVKKAAAPKIALAQRNVSRIPTQRKKSPPRRSNSRRRSSSLQNLPDAVGADDKDDNESGKVDGDSKKDGKKAHKSNKSPKVCKKCTSSHRDHDHAADCNGGGKTESGESGGENDDDDGRKSSSKSPRDGSSKGRGRSSSPQSSSNKSTKTGSPRGTIQREESSSNQDDASVAGTTDGSSGDGGSISVNMAKSFVQRGPHGPGKRVKPPGKFRP